MEQQFFSKLVKKYVKAVYCHPAYLTCMQSTSCEMLGWMNHKLKSRLPRDLAITSDIQMTPLYSLKTFLIRMKYNSEKAGLRLNIQNTKIVASGPNISWQIDGEKVYTMTDFISLGSKITADGDCHYEIKRFLLPGRKVMTILNSLLKSRDITLPTKVYIVKSLVFQVMYRCESWTIKEAEC